jgi:ribonuclease D
VETVTAPLQDAQADRPQAEPLLAPRDGVPPVVETAAHLAEVIATFAGGTGPLAVDAERASGYRYSQRAYLVQLRREGAGTALIDPIVCPDLSVLSAVLQDSEWVLHAASQDIPCLAEVGMVAPAVFDTELAGRLAGFERVGLGAMVENVLGLSALTVKSHLARIARKLGTGDRAEMVALAMRAGVIR